MKTIKKLLSVSLLLVLGSFLIACGNKSDTTTTTSTPAPTIASSEAATPEATAENVDATTGETYPDVINIGVIEGGPESAILVQEKLLENLGVKANIVSYSAGTDINNAVVSGDVDLACFGSSPIALGLANGINYKAVYVSYLEGGNIEALVVKNSAGLNSVAELKGKTIATPFGTTSHYALLNALELAGLSASDVSLLDMGGADIVAAWTRGDIDATYIWSPAQDECVKDGKILTNDGELAEQGITIPEIAVARNEFAEKYPTLVTAYVKALISVSDLVNNDPEKATEDVAAWEGISVDSAKGQVNDNIWISGADQLTGDYLGTADSKGKLADTLKTIADFHAEQGNLGSSPDVSLFKDAIDTSYVEAALK
ncbi:MAG: hypothetical protein K0S04_1927 [Herbinix sp.]|jgi:taurine transport system substrate-binding protein|nr:hypothetical protein [Herbinix sp.]